MTWTAHLDVQDVSNGPAPIDILAVSDDVMSSTEGKIAGVEVRIRLDVDETSIKVGDTIVVSGHFQG